MKRKPLTEQTVEEAVSGKMIAFRLSREEFAMLQSMAIEAGYGVTVTRVAHTLLAEALRLSK